LKSCIKKLVFYGRLVNIKRGDTILCIALLFCAISGMFLPMLHAKQGTTLLIRINGVSYTEAPLFEDKVIELKEDNTIYNIVTIKDGQATMSHSTCFNQLCVRQTAISSTHETIICLPHKVILEIVSDTDSQIDAISK